MSRWQRGEAEIERLLTSGELQALTGAAADGEPWRGHYAVEVAVRSQFGDKFDRFGGLGRQRDDIEYPVNAAARLTPDDAQSAIALATEFTEAAEQLRPHLGLFS